MKPEMRKLQRYVVHNTQSKDWLEYDDQMDICCMTKCGVEELEFKFGKGCCFLCDRTPMGTSYMGVYTYDDEELSVRTARNTFVRISKCHVIIISREKTRVSMRENKVTIVFDNAFKI